MTETRKSNRAVGRSRCEKFVMAFLVLAWVLMPVAPLRGQATLPGANKPPVSADAPARLPGTTEEIDRALTQIETRLAKAREQAAGDAPEATPDELAQRQRLFQQWVLALEAQSSSLRRLKEIRQFNQDRAAEAGSWNGFSQKPPSSTASARMPNSSA